MDAAPNVLTPSALTAAELASLVDATAAVEAWPAGSHVWGHYAEQTDRGPAICRTENVSACRPDEGHRAGNRDDPRDGPLNGLEQAVTEQAERETHGDFSHVCDEGCLREHLANVY